MFKYRSAKIIATHAKTKYYPAIVSAIPETDKTRRIFIPGRIKLSKDPGPAFDSHATEAVSGQKAVIAASYSKLYRALTGRLPLFMLRMNCTAYTFYFLNLPL